MLTAIDTYWASFISTEALAALVLTFPLFFMVLAFAHGLTTGATALISNAIGAQDQNNIKRMTAQVLSFSILTYCLLAPLCIWSGPRLFSILGASGEYLRMCVSFMNVIFTGLIFLILTYAFNSVLLAHGNSRCLRNYSIGSCLLNFILDPWFIYGGFGLPSLGLQGIALATVTVMFLGSLYMGFEAYWRGYLSGLKPAHFIPNLRIFGIIAEQSFPASLGMMMMGLRIFLMAHFVSHFGQETVAGFGIGIRIEELFLLPIYGLRLATLSIVAQNNGAKQLNRIREVAAQSSVYGLVLMSVGAFFMIVMPESMVRFISNDEAVIKAASNYLHIMGWTSWGFVLSSILEATLQGMKHPFFPFFTGIMRQLILPFIAFYLLTIEWEAGLNSLWWSLVLIRWGFTLIIWIYLRRVLIRHRWL